MAAFGSGADDGPSEVRFEIAHSLELPEVLEWARDIRWLTSDEVVMASPRAGVFRMNLADPEAGPVLVVERGNRKSAAWLPRTLGVSERLLVTGSPAFSVGWKQWNALGPVPSVLLDQTVYFESVPDLDLHGDMLVVLGLRKGERGTGESLPYAHEGAYLWLGHLASRDEPTFRPLAFSASGAEALAMDGCSLFAPGSVRFADDGSFIVVPQGEHGVQHYDASGRLKRAWSSREGGFDSGCDLEREQVYRFSRDVEARQAWVNQRRIVEDIAFVAGRPALLVRERVNQVTQWQLNVLGDTTRIRTIAVPIESASGRARLRLDFEGDRFAFLLGSVENPPRRPAPLASPQADRPEAPPRVIVAVLKEPEGG